MIVLGFREFGVKKKFIGDLYLYLLFWFFWFVFIFLINFWRKEKWLEKSKVKNSKIIYDCGYLSLNLEFYFKLFLFLVIIVNVLVFK